MPLTVAEGAVVGAGMMFASAATFFYKRKQTLPFKVAYFMSWPTLGTAVMWAVTPSSEELAKKMERRGQVTEAQLQAAHNSSALQMEALKQTAAEASNKQQ